MLAITATTSSLNTGNRKSSGQRAQFPMKSEIAYRKALASDMDRVGELIREYAGSIGVDIEYQGLSEELAGLPGKYAEPKGAILVAQRSSCLVGMVALRDLGDGACEMKRLYVATSARGLGIGAPRYPPQHGIRPRAVPRRGLPGKGSLYLQPPSRRRVYGKNP
ncbi:MAG: GCN5-like N-acetyltransferase [Spirochaetes bacterium]|nr:MAG: GCN5-like N-acetyltransferase [Spirochaetota bacterium]